MNKPKFRAYVKSINKVLPVCELSFRDNDDLPIGVDGYEMWYRTDEVILMQYTGLKDKKGKQYCQDDLVRYEGKIYRLIKGSYAFELVGFYNSYQDNPNDFFSEQAHLLGEIVGDLYTNPELLNEVE